MDTDKLTLEQFGLGILAGLRVKEVTKLDKYYLMELQDGFFDAYRIVQRQLGDVNLDFMLVRDSYGMIEEVDSIFLYWTRGLWVSNQGVGTTYRFKLRTSTAEEYLVALPGGRDLYLQAADAFLSCYSNV